MDKDPIGGDSDIVRLFNSLNTPRSLLPNTGRTAGYKLIVISILSRIVQRQNQYNVNRLITYVSYNIGKTRAKQ